MLSNRSGLRNKQGGSIAELGPTLWILLILIILPLVDLLSFVWGVATVMFMANNAVRDAAPQQTFSAAIASVQQSEVRVKSLQNFAKMAPAQGNNRGMEIFVVRTPVNHRPPATYSPPPANNKIPNDETSLADNIYQYQVTASYDVSPIFNFSGMPVFSNIPGLGRPVLVSFTSTAQVEHPEGLNN